MDQTPLRLGKMMSGMTTRCERAVQRGEVALILKYMYVSYIYGGIYLWVSFDMTIYAYLFVCMGHIYF